MRRGSVDVTVQVDTPRLVDVVSFWGDNVSIDGFQMSVGHPAMFVLTRAHVCGALRWASRDSCASCITFTKIY